MSNDVNLHWLDMGEAEVIDALRGSIYPGQPAESIKLVLAYCRAAQLDPFQKPVHLVPMSTKIVEGGREKYVKINTVMPGIGLYRVQAARTGAYAGQDEPEFGPMNEFDYQKKVSKWEGPQGDRRETVAWEKATVKFPEWVRVTVYRIVQSVRCPFVAIEYWMENYATASKDTLAPNEMWARRTRGQLVKCAEAQALRKGFPEVGAQPTAEEMMGRIRDDDTIELEPEARTPPQRASAAPAAPAIEHQPADPLDLRPKADATPEKVPAAPPKAAPAPAKATAPPPAAAAPKSSAADDLEPPGWADDDAGLSTGAPAVAPAPPPPGPPPAAAPAAAEPMASQGECTWAAAKFDAYKVTADQRRVMLAQVGATDVAKLTKRQWSELKSAIMKMPAP